MRPCSWPPRLTVAPAASAHAHLIATDPATDAALTAGPSEVSATFNEQLQTAFAAMTVVGPDGNLWSTGEPRVQGAVVSVHVMPLGPAGVYTVNYRVTSGDGHPVSGSWSFQLTTPGTGQPGPSAATHQGPPGGIPIWPFLALFGGGNRRRHLVGSPPTNRLILSLHRNSPLGLISDRNRLPRPASRRGSSSSCTAVHRWAATADRRTLVLA